MALACPRVRLEPVDKAQVVNYRGGATRDEFSTKNGS